MNDVRMRNHACNFGRQNACSIVLRRADSPVSGGPLKSESEGAAQYHVKHNNSVVRMKKSYPILGSTHDCVRIDLIAHSACTKRFVQHENNGIWKILRISTKERTFVSSLTFRTTKWNETWTIFTSWIEKLKVIQCESSIVHCSLWKPFSKIKDLLFFDSADNENII